MIAVVKLSALAAMSYLIFTLVFSIIRPVSARRKKNVRNFMHKAKNQARREKLIYFKDIILRKVAARVLLSDLKRDEYKGFITRLDLKITPEELRAQQLLLAFAALAAALLVFQINPLLGYLSFLGPVLGWMYPVDELERKIEQKNGNIMLDFPSFYEY